MQNIPIGKTYLVAIKHVSIFDPPFVLALWLEMRKALGSIDLWNRTGRAQLVKLYHGMPVHRGKFDRALFDNVLSVLAMAVDSQ